MPKPHMSLRTHYADSKCNKYTTADNLPSQWIGVTAIGASLKFKGKIYSAYVRSTLIYGIKTSLDHQGLGYDLYIVSNGLYQGLNNEGLCLELF